MHKLDAVLTALSVPHIAEWYETEHNTTAEDFNARNVSIYGLTGKGYIADLILADYHDHLGQLIRELNECIADDINDFMSEATNV